jgi:hypothetical protein
MQDPQHPRMRQLAPQHLPLVRPMEHAPREDQALRAERLDRGRGRTGAAEGAKELANTLAHARVGVQAHPLLGVVDKADGQAHLQLAAPRLVENAPAQPRAQDMQFRLAHRALQTQQQPVIEVHRIVDAILIENQRIDQRTELQQAMPVGGIARQARHLQPHDDAGVPQAHLRDQALKPRTIRGTGARLPEVRIDHDHLLLAPPERDGASLQGILALGAFAILQHLAQGRLAHVQIGIALEVAGLDFGVDEVAHIGLSRVLANTMVARMSITGWCTPAGRAVRAGRGIAARAPPSAQLCIQATMPWRINRARARRLG